MCLYTKLHSFWCKFNDVKLKKINDTHMSFLHTPHAPLLHTPLWSTVVTIFPLSIFTAIRSVNTSHLLLLFNGTRTTSLPSFTEGRAFPLHYKQVATAIATICQLHMWYSSYLPFRISLLLFNLGTYDNWPCSAGTAGFEPAGHYWPTP